MQPQIGTGFGLSLLIFFNNNRYSRKTRLLILFITDFFPPFVIVLKPEQLTLGRSIFYFFLVLAFYSNFAGQDAT